MDMQFTSPCLEVNITKWLQSAYFQLGEFDKYAPISGKVFKVEMALTIQIGAHLLDLKISHIAYPTAQCALMRPWTPELKTLNQTLLRQHLPGRAYYL